MAHGGFQGPRSAQIAKLGYPLAFDSGYPMIRTDSLGYWTTPSNVILGTDQTGGSSGAPWIVNLGKSPGLNQLATEKTERKPSWPPQAGAMSTTK